MTSMIVKWTLSTASIRLRERDLDQTDGRVPVQPLDFWCFAVLHIESAKDYVPEHIYLL